MAAINIPDVLSFFAKAEALLGALVAGGIVKSNSGIEIAQVLGDVSAVVAGAQHPSADLANTVEKLLGDLGADGVVKGQFIDEISQAAAKFASVQNAVQTGQAALLATGDLLGKHGDFMFIPDGGPAKAALGG